VTRPIPGKREYALTQAAGLNHALFAVLGRDILPAELFLVCRVLKKSVSPLSSLVVKKED
jgi:hypothetical protein